jgi:hypothetical protein
MANAIGVGIPDMHIEFGFSPGPVFAVDDLLVLWQRARTVAENTPPCPCHGIVRGLIDPDVMEDNMLNPLRSRYRAAGQAELYSLIERRLRKPPFAGMQQSFSDWLRDLREAPLGGAEKKVLYEDLAVGLRAFADNPAPFSCD